jgi:Tetratricopeptide repeat
MLKAEIYTPKLGRMIGRQKYLEEIKEILNSSDTNSAVFYIEGRGGVGKTRLLEEILHFTVSFPQVVTSGIIDLYDSNLHDIDNLQHFLAESLDPENLFFKNYRLKYAEVQQKREAQFAENEEMQELLERKEREFLWDYEKLSRNKRIILAFDTLEIIQYEKDEFEQEFEFEQEEASAKTWLLEELSRLPNSIILLASRPVRTLQTEIAGACRPLGSRFKYYNLEKFSYAEQKEYLAELKAGNAQLEELLDPELEGILLDKTEGLPIRLTMLVDLLLYGEELSTIFPLNLHDAQEVKPAQLEQVLVERLRQLAPPYSQMFDFLRCARKGLDLELLRNLVGDFEVSDWENDLKNSALVKYRVNSKQFFLHDEVADLFDKYYRDDPELRAGYLPFVAYYSSKYDSPDTAISSLPENTVTAWLFYELQANPIKGYEKFVVWNEQLLQDKKNQLAILLRQEMRRFTKRYLENEDTGNIAVKTELGNLPKRNAALDKVNTLLVSGDNAQTLEKIEKIFQSDNPNFGWKKIDDPLYKARLLVMWGEVLTYLGRAEADVKAKYQQAQTLCTKSAFETDFQKRQANLLQGRIRNNLGYLYSNQGLYNLALQEYKKALTFFRVSNITHEESNTLNNIAFSQALIGQATTARRYVEQALEMRESSGSKYEQALSRNTLGLVLTRQGFPEAGINECLEALKMCESQGQVRGIGLACNALGYAYRKLGERWRDKVINSDQARHSYDAGFHYLMQAKEIFSTAGKEEPARLWECYNELGSLKREQGLLLRNRMQPEGILAIFEESLNYEVKGLEQAQKVGLKFFINESLEDLAQIHGEIYFLLKELGKTEKAVSVFSHANAYLAEIIDNTNAKYHLQSGIGFIEAEANDDGTADWLALGKVYRWSGSWLFEENKNSTETGYLAEAVEYLLLSAVYFERYWLFSKNFREALERLLAYLQDVKSVTAEWGLKQVEIFAEKYNFPNLRIYKEAITNALIT